MSDDPVEALETRILPLLERAVSQLQGDFPNATFHTETGAVGSLTSLQGHHVAISAVLHVPDLRREQPDLVDLVVGVRHLTTKPELYSLYVCWGHPSGHVELDLLSSPVVLDDGAWRRAELAIPALIDALRQAVQRGQPPEDAKPLFPC